MTTRTKDAWQAIMDAKVASPLSNADFCRQHDIPIQASLIKPCKALQSSCCEYIAELGDDERYPYPLDLDHSNFRSRIHTLTQYSKGEDLPDWMVPNST